MVRLLISVLAFLVLLSASTDAQAQRVPMRRTTLSPYLNLFRGNTGGVNPFFTFVQPALNQQQFIQQQTRQNLRLQQQILTNQAGLAGPFAGQLPPGQSIVAPLQTGVGSTRAPASYFNYSHYYGVPTRGPGLVIQRRR